MSAGMVSAAKRELVAAGLVCIKPGSKRDGTADEITVVDIWAVNYNHFRARADAQRAARPATRQQDAALADDECIQIVNDGCSQSEPKKHPPSGSAQPDIETTTRIPPAAVVAPPASAHDGERLTPATTQLLDGKNTIAPPGDAMLETMVAAIVRSRETAQTLIRRYGAARCQQQLAWLEHRAAKDAGAMYAQSVRENWAEPTVLRRAREEQEHKAAQAAQAALARERADAEKRDKAARAAAIESWYAALPADQRAVVDAAALREAQRHPLFARMQARGGPMLEATLRAARAQIITAWMEGGGRPHA
jgi:hypothetical protein